MKNKIYHAIGRYFQKVSRWFFHRTLMACWHCGALVGMNSTYTRGHMWCEPCLQRYVMPELRNAQQSRAPDASEQKTALELPEWYEMAREFFGEIQVFSTDMYNDMNGESILTQLRYAAEREAKAQFSERSERR